MEAEVSHCHLLAKRRAAYRRRNEECTETEKGEMRKLKRRGVSACNVFLIDIEWVLGNLAGTQIEKKCPYRSAILDLFEKRSTRNTMADGASLILRL